MKITYVPSDAELASLCFALTDLKIYHYPDTAVYANVVASAPVPADPEAELLVDVSDLLHPSGSRQVVRYPGGWQGIELREHTPRGWVQVFRGEVRSLEEFQTLLRMVLWTK